MSKGWKKQPARHALAALGVRTKDPITILEKWSPGSTKLNLYLDTRYAENVTTGKKVRVPFVLYHGTALKNLPKIAKEGLRINMPRSGVTAEFGFEEDTRDNVSFSVKENETRMFALGSNFEYLGEQIEDLVSREHKYDMAILAVSTSHLPDRPFTARVFMNKSSGEFKYWGNVPPDAIRSVKIVTNMGKKEEILDFSSYRLKIAKQELGIE